MSLAMLLIFHREMYDYFDGNTLKQIIGKGIIKGKKIASYHATLVWRCLEQHCAGQTSANQGLPLSSRSIKIQ